MSSFWAKLIDHLRTITNSKRTWILTSVLLSVALGISLMPVQAGDRVDPQLREQVLQIIRENPQVILEAVRDYQKQQQQAEATARQDFITQMKRNPKAIIGKSPSKGAENGKVVLVEFSDFQCPFCARAQDALNQFVTKHSDRVTLVYKHFPLTQIHPEALPAAKASWAAAQQGKFWEFHDALFTNQKALNDAFYLETAKKLGLDIARFNRDRNSAAAAQAIEQDIQMARQLGVDGTPFFVMNGEAFSGALSLAELEEVLEKVSRSPDQ